MWCSRGCLGPPASTKACWWHVELDGGSRRRGCAAGGVSVKINRPLGGDSAVELVRGGAGEPGDAPRGPPCAGAGLDELADGLDGGRVGAGALGGAADDEDDLAVG